MDKKKLAEDFRVTAAHYGLAELGELEQAKQAVRDDPENAAISYGLMAQEVMGAAA